VRAFPVVVPQAFTAVLVALTTAVADVVVVDLLPSSGGVGRPALWRWVLLAVLGLLLVGSVVWAWWIRSTRGSAYVIQVQDQTAARWHTGPLIAETLRHLNVNILVERLDLGGTGQLMMADTVTSLAHELRADQNGDDDSTGFSYYPNMLFSAALTLGYQWEPPRSAVFFELNDAKERNEYSFSLTKLTRKPVVEPHQRRCRTVGPRVPPTAPRQSRDLSDAQPVPRLRSGFSRCRRPLPEDQAAGRETQGRHRDERRLRTVPVVGTERAP